MAYCKYTLPHRLGLVLVFEARQIPRHRRVFLSETTHVSPTAVSAIFRMFDQPTKKQHGGLECLSSHNTLRPSTTFPTRCGATMVLTESFERPIVFESIICLGGSVSRSSSSPLVAAVPESPLSPPFSVLMERLLIMHGTFGAIICERLHTSRVEQAARRL